MAIIKGAASKAVIYTRVSTEQQGEGTSLDSQFIACRAKAEQLGASVVASFQDMESGASYRSRHGLQSALTAIENGEADTLIIYDMSRYSRDSEHQQQILKRVQITGGRLAFCTLEVGDLSTPEQRLNFGMTGMFAEYERLKIRERTMTGREAKAKKGEQVGRSSSAFGYHVVTKTDVLRGEYPADQIGKYIILEAESKLAIEIFKRASEGNSLRGIAAWLMDQGVLAPQGGIEWSPSSVRAILKNPVYKGVGGYSKTITTRVENAKGGKSRVTRPNPNPITFEAPALVSVEMWDLCQRRMVDNKTLSSGPRARKWLLSGLIFCPLCGGSMTARLYGIGSRKMRLKPSSEWTHEERLNNATYKCSRSFMPLDKERRCPGTKIKAATVETEVLIRVAEYITNPRVMEDYWRERHAQESKPSSSGNITDWKRELKELQALEEATVDAQIQAVGLGVPTAIYTRKLEGIAHRRQELERQINQHHQGQRKTKSLKEMPKQNFGGDVEKILLGPPEQIPVLKKREILLQFVEKVIPNFNETKAIEIVFRPYSDT
ncbi:recombinase family protein [bacterium]|nr:MAG: recombinase family protein [bacterium]